MSFIDQSKGCEDIRNQPILNKSTEQQTPNSEVAISIGAKRQTTMLTFRHKL